MRRSFAFAVKSADELSSRQDTRERLLNMYAEPDGAKEPVKLLTCLGLDNTTALTAVPERTIDGLAKFQGEMYAACGGFLYRMTPTVTAIGTIGVGPARFAASATELAISANGVYHLYDGTSITKPSIGALTDCIDVAYADGYFVLASSSGRFAVTGLFDGTTIAGLDFATAESKPDPLEAVVVSGSLLYLLGKQTLELWQNSGGADFPFARLDGGTVDRGCSNGETAVLIDSTLIWLSDDERVFFYDGAQGRAISTPALNRIIAQYDPSQLSAFPYTDAGHKFYVLRFPDRPAWCFDTQTALWHERTTGIGDNAWEAVHALYHDSDWWAGTTDGQVMRMRGRETDNGATYKRIAQSGPLRLSGHRFRVKDFDLDAKMGRRADGADATVTLELSRDGETWEPARQRVLGKLGEYENVARWHALGQFREVSARVWVSDPADFQIYGAAAEVIQDGG